MTQLLKTIPIEGFCDRAGNIACPLNTNSGAAIYVQRQNPERLPVSVLDGHARTCAILEQRIDGVRVTPPRVRKANCTRLMDSVSKTATLQETGDRGYTGRGGA
ncbi:uncharacterized protein mtcp1.L isoform X1 [Xenopus laevis]|uniref:Uncharacterized protein mtcp1.L isoform X1 n=1 Tax=Xenopus laevis TaxID=8355 RepID=A0A8J0TA80_XENLA|nr:uncharacterized protein mtcp1.L isoform X1 [Xenopus laevis]